jgi:hypothetical protein
VIATEASQGPGVVFIAAATDGFGTVNPTKDPEFGRAYCLLPPLSATAMLGQAQGGDRSVLSVRSGRHLGLSATGLRRVGCIGRCTPDVQDAINIRVRSSPHDERPLRGWTLRNTPW